MRAVVSCDPGADAYEYAEKRLTAWGKECAKNSERLGLPTISSIATMIAHIRRLERLRKGVRKKALKQKHRQQRKNGESVDAKEVAEVKGFAETDLTAHGKQDKVFREAKIEVSSEAAEIDYIVSRLQPWAEKIIVRTYKFGQWDEVASAGIGMRQGEYAQRRRAATEMVAQKLGNSYIRATRRGV